MGEKCLLSALGEDRTEGGVDVVQNKLLSATNSSAVASSLPFLGEEQLEDCSQTPCLLPFLSQFVLGENSLMRLPRAIPLDVYHLRGTILIPTFAVQYEP